MALADERTGIIYGRAIQFYANGKQRDYDYAHEFQPLPEGDIFSRLFTDACFIAMSSAVLRRSALEDVGPIPDAIQTVPDYYLYVAVARRYPARAVQGKVCRYRMHAGSMSQTNRQRLHREPLLIIDQWAECLDPRLVAYRRMTYSTALALEEMRSLKTFRLGLVRMLRDGSVSYTHLDVYKRQGLVRMLRDGSVIWLMSRSFVRVWRALRRKLRRPYWMGTDFTSDPD